MVQIMACVAAETPSSGKEPTSGSMPKERRKALISESTMGNCRLGDYCTI
jgi:hypothetical protein